MFHDIVEIKPKCRGLEIKFLTMLDPPYIGQSTGNHLYFTMVPFFCSEKLPKSVEKVILLKKVPEIYQFLKVLTITEKN